MTALDAFRAEQRRVARGIAAAVLVATAALAAAWTLAPGAVIARPNAADRLALAAAADAFVFAWLAIAVAHVARLRFLSSQDIGGSADSGASGRVARAVALLQNTLEQAVLAAGAHLALATQLPPGRMLLVPVLVALFGAGRLAFFIGYARGAGARAFGFALTFYPSVAALLAAAILSLV